MSQSSEQDLSKEVENLARVQQDLEHQYTRWEAAKKYPKVIVYTLCLLWVAISCGYEGQASGIVVSIPVFRRDFGYAYGDGSDYVLDSKWHRLPPSLVRLVVRGFLIFTAVFFVGKFLNSLVLGLIQAVVTSLMAELVPLALRGLCVSAINLSFCIGPFICYLIADTTTKLDTRMAYRAIFLSQWAFSGVSLVLLWIVPESPYFHVLRGNKEKAAKCLTKIYKDSSLVQNQLALIEQTAEESKILAKSGSFVTLFKKANRRRTTAAISMSIMMAMCGLPYIYSYSTYYFQLAGFSTEASFQISVGGQALSMVGTISSWFIIDRFGRRAVTMYAVGSLGIVNILTAALGIKRKEPYNTAAVAFMTMYNFFYNSGIGPLAFLISSEIPTSQLRAKTISVGLSLNFALQCFWQFVLPEMFNPDKANMGSNINFIFAGCCFVGLFFFYFYLPETANKSFEEIDELYINHIPPRQSKAYKSQLGASDALTEEYKLQTAHLEKADSLDKV